MRTGAIDVAAAATVLRALANPGRLQIVLRLLDGEASVAELEKELGLRQPNLSQQLAELRDAGLVVGRRRSKFVIYGLADDEQRRLVAALAYGFGAADAPQLADRVVGGGRPRREGLGAVFATVLSPG